MFYTESSIMTQLMASVKCMPRQMLKEMLISSELFQFRNYKVKQIQIQSTMLLLLLACVHMSIN